MPCPRMREAEKERLDLAARLAAARASKRLAKVRAEKAELLACLKEALKILALRHDVRAQETVSRIRLTIGRMESK